MLEDPQSLDIMQVPLVRILGKRTGSKLSKLKLKTVLDLLNHFPRRYATRGELTDLGHLQVDEIVSVVASVSDCVAYPLRTRRGSLVVATITDGKDFLELVFFPRSPGMEQYFKRLLQPGAQGIFSGKVSKRDRKFQLTHPQMSIFTDNESLEDGLAVVDHPIPIYPLTEGINTTTVWKSVKSILNLVDKQDFPEVLPDSYRKEHGLIDVYRAYCQLHLPESPAHWQAAQIYFRHREAFILRTALGQQRAKLLKRGGQIFPKSEELLRYFDTHLPFVLTPSQQETSNEISADIAKDVPMQRIVQGDVGSGKTVVALRALLQVVGQGGQGFFLAPTEVLAAQHLRTMQYLLGDLSSNGKLGYQMPKEVQRILKKPTRIVLITGNLTAKERTNIELEIISGQADIVVGTHALLFSKVVPYNLGLVVIDEQQRFGVRQRDEAIQKSTSIPHLLVLSATPIPRTVAQTVFGDLDISRIETRTDPADRVETHLVSESENSLMARVWARAKEEINRGGRVFVVCPRIEAEVESSSAILDSEIDADGGKNHENLLASVEHITSRIQKIPQLAEVNIASLHGRLEAKEKEQIIDKFRQGSISMLVSTTVIEVGIDIPDATMIVIIDADRFGLSQLHQLRGRVGRGNKSGLCVAITKAQPETSAWKRLEVFTRLHDGFALAEADLELRSEGDVLGQAQSGRKSTLKLLRLHRDQEIVAQARIGVQKIIDEDPDLEDYPEISQAVAQILEGESAEFLGKA